MPGASSLIPIALWLAASGISSGFGYRSDPLHGGRRMHEGIDIPGRAGTAIRASAAGIVSFAGRAGGYGNMIEVDHGGGLSTRYAHLNRIAARAGDAVSQSQIVGFMGATGRATGSHLHFEVRVNGRAVDPLRFLNSGRPLPRRVPGKALPPQRHLSAYAIARTRAAAAEGTVF